MVKFSLIIPSYNSENYISEAVESVINQEYQDWELIIVDDGSTDSSGAICDQYARQDGRIKVIHTDNRGEYASRISGMKEASGEYILSCDSDDYLETDCLKLLNRVIEQTNVDVVIYEFNMFGAAEGQVGIPMQSGRVFSAFENILTVLDSTNHSLCNKAIRSSAIKKAIQDTISRRFDICADYALIIPILCNTKNAVYIDRSLYNYRIYESSMSHNVTIQHVIDIHNSTGLIIRELQKYDMFNEKMCRAVYIAYLKAMSGRCNALMRQGEVKKSVVDHIHASKLYINSRRYEKIGYFNFHSYAILKIFRYKLFLIFELYLRVRKRIDRVVRSQRSR